METRLKDIIEINPIKDYITIGDGDKDPKGITSGFVLTDDIKHSYELILDKISKGAGAGFLIKGDYGSGKTDTLEYLSLLLKNKDLPPIESFPSLITTPINITKFSLRDYGPDSSLERIFLKQFGYVGEVFKRDELYTRLIQENTLIIADELSEYLDAHPGSLEADIGFLVYLAEYIAIRPIWFIAALQEWVEETRNARASRVVQRLKERSVCRLTLSTTHVEELIDKAIICKKEGSDEIIRQIFATVRMYFPRLQLTYGQFHQTFPLHPVTVSYLAGLTPIFSRARGVIQFVKAEVAKVLEEPADTLITPDKLFDHFEDRIRENSDYSPLARVVYDYYKLHIKEAIAGNARLQESALSAIKVLILTEISAIEKRKTASEIGEMLLKKISSHAGESANYSYMESILDQLVAHGMFIKKGNDGTYYIDTKADEALRIKSRIKRVIADRLTDKRMLFDKIVEYTNKPPLKMIAAGQENWQITWENSPRWYRCFLPLTTLKKPDIDGWVNAVETYTDCCLIVLSPFAEENKEFPSHVAKTENLSPRFLPLIAFWVPRTPLASEIAIMETYIAKKELVAEFPGLEGELKKDDYEFQNLVHSIYTGGEIVYASGEKRTAITEVAGLPMISFIENIFQDALARVYPRHHEIMTQKSMVSANEITTLYNTFLRKGNISIEEAKTKGIVDSIKKILYPLGIIKQTGQGFAITIDVANELISYILSLTAQTDNLAAISKALQKSKWGLSRDQIAILLSVLIASGQLVACNNEGMVDLRDISMLHNSEEIKSIKAGKTLSAAMLSYIPRGKFIWGDVEDIPTPVTQRNMWRAAAEFLGTSKKLLEELRDSIPIHKDSPIFKWIPIKTDLMNSLYAFVHSMPRSLSPAEGIEKFLFYLQDNEDLESDMLYLGKLHSLFTRQINDLKRAYLYLSHPELKVPRGDAGRGMSLEETRTILLAQIKDYLSVFDGDFEDIINRWNQFQSQFTSFYMEQHQIYYNSGVFTVKKQIEDSEQARALQRIAKYIDTENFRGEWWEIRRELDRPPVRCMRDPNDVLPMRPSCICGFEIGTSAPETTVNLSALCDEGILNFVRMLQTPAVKHKLDTCSISGTSKKEIAKVISKLTTIRVDKTSPSMILPLLTNEVLTEIGQIVRGQWKFKELRLADLSEIVSGGRYKQKDLKSILLNWIGEDEDTILHVKKEQGTAVSNIEEQLAKYGPSGERAWIDIKNELRDGADVDMVMAQESTRAIMRSIKLGVFSVNELIEFLSRESIAQMKQLLRGELYRRFKGKSPLDKSQEALITDEPMKDLLAVTSILTHYQAQSGVELFTRSLAPLSLIHSKIVYEDAHEPLFDQDQEIMADIKQDLDKIIQAFGSQPDKFRGARSLVDLRGDLPNGNIVILDGLRYDLWFTLKAIMVADGWVIKKEYPYIVPTPTSTANFREVMGIGDELHGNIGDRSYSLTKWVERDAGRKALRKALKGPEDLKFFHANFIDTKIHNSTLDLYPLYLNIETEFKTGILPLMEDLKKFIIIADHGFSDSGKLKGRYTHGQDSVWERVLPCVYVGGV